MSFENGNVRTLRLPLILLPTGLGAVVSNFSPIDANVIVLSALDLTGTATFIRSSQSSEETFLTLEIDGSPVRLARLRGHISTA
jgi:hypothetical protein